MALTTVQDSSQDETKEMANNGPITFIDLLDSKFQEDKKEILDQIYYGYEEGNTIVEIVNEKQKDEGTNIDIRITSKINIDGVEKTISIMLNYFEDHYERRKTEKEFLKRKLDDYIEGGYKPNLVKNAVLVTKSKIMSLLSA